MAEWPDNKEDVIKTQLTFDWLLDQRRYVDKYNTTEPWTENSIEGTFIYFSRRSPITIDTLPDFLWDAGEIQIRSRDKKVKRNLVTKNIYYNHGSLRTRMRYIPTFGCPEPYDEPPLMLTVQDVIDKCVRTFDWRTETSEQRMAAFIYDLERYESECNADKLDIVMYYIDSMLNTFGLHCNSSKFFDIGNLDEALERTYNNALLHNRTNTDKYVYRNFILHEE